MVGGWGHFHSQIMLGIITSQTPLPFQHLFLSKAFDKETRLKEFPTLTWLWNPVLANILTLYLHNILYNNPLIPTKEDLRLI